MKHIKIIILILSFLMVSKISGLRTGNELAAQINDHEKIGESCESVKSFDFSKWKITFPVSDKEGDLSGGKGSAYEVKNPEFKTWGGNNALIPDGLKKYFYKNGTNWVFFTPYTGVTTSRKAKYSRTELREMKGSEQHNWPLSLGGILEGRLKIYGIKNKARKIFFMQIHAKSPVSKPLLKCIWEKTKIRLLTKKGKKLKDYQGKKSYGNVEEDTWFTFKIIANNDSLKIYLNNKLIEEYGHEILKSWPDNNTYYFKAGNYLQNKNEGAAAVMKFSSIKVSH